MKVLCFSSLYPNAAQPSHGVFVENRLRRLVETGEVEARVIAPVPWFPFTGKSFGEYGQFAAAPQSETRHGIDILHPRHVVLPKIGMYLTPKMMVGPALKAAKKLIASGFDFDIIDAHYFYPDGVAAMHVAQALGKPFMVTARGTDINLIPAYPKARDMILEVGEAAQHLGAVCQALADEMIDIGLPADKTVVLRNGVDLDGFSPVDRTAARKTWEVDGPTIVSVGGLIERKGHNFTIEALKALPEFTFLLAGSGPEEGSLRALAQKHGVAERVRFLGRVPHDELSVLFSAADLSVLASSREGWANVLLESMACGTPVVATNVWGTPEVVDAPAAGVLSEARTAEAIAKGVQALWRNMPERSDTRKHAERFAWGPTTQMQLKLFKSMIEAPALGGS